MNNRATFNSVPLLDDQRALNAWFGVLAEGGSQETEVAFAILLGTVQALRASGMDDVEIREVIMLGYSENAKDFAPDVRTIELHMINQALEYTSCPPP